MVRNGLALLITFLVFSCQDQSKKEEGFQLPSSDYVILKYNPEWYWIFKDAASSDLSKKELEEIEVILQSAIEKHNRNFIDKPESFQKWALELKRYKRQYVPIINQKGEKIVWINFFCNSDFYKSYWEKEILSIDDGGNCYFNIKINLTTKKYFDLRINGYA